MSRKKEKEVKNELEKVEEVKEEKVEKKEDKQVEEKKETPKKASKFFSEFKAFLGIVLIIGLLILGGWYWYNHQNPRKGKEPKDVITSSKIGYNYTLISSKNDMNIYYNKYVIDKTDDGYLKIMTLDGSTLYEGQASEYDSFILGYDNNLYFIKDDDAENENIITLYRLDNKEITKVFEIYDSDIYLDQIVYCDSEGFDYLIGFAGSEKYSDGEVKTVIYSLDGNKEELDGYEIIGDSLRTGAGEEFRTANPSYISFGNAKVQGLYDLDKMEVAIDPSYDELKSTHNNSFIVIKNNKTGIINEKQKKLVDFEYDFIDYNVDFYVVSKNHKLAIMNKDYKLVTGFDFDYLGNQEYKSKLCCAEYNTFAAYKIGNKYLLVTNINASGEDFIYSKNEAYIINSDGKYETVPETGYGITDNSVYFYSSNDKKISFYNHNLEHMYDLDYTDYDVDINDLYFTKVQNALHEETLDLYYNATTGEELENFFPVYENMNIKIEYKNEKYIVYVDDKVVEKIDGEAGFNIININKGFYLAGNDSIIVFKEK